MFVSYFVSTKHTDICNAEEVTLISHHHVTDETYAAAAKVLDEQLIAQVIMATININGWNRIAISTHMQPALD